ncbi:hypothetical protein EMIHUDRAFT_448133 [Emiliania huxleyi CCMP1516]|uniref:Glycosyltransferase 2-like domain-containing protein n=2 Tax=Emiliania huxleyi TaxID=2903 RepID=A0A0D3ITJ8_EMIH1|nr:hypothetical protein EMIHUDRAFT_448133 [Emiliania huxleyi CCMP1516]EOD14583.1 hypothetical protein EMIHUDRAFT_448133 [Emiliania huxleyi CCMP1516]|eukprot:XP_005767012.1 hypothetical protein EMIHUDRAFT_448133 [Emiliania huxleyi CCMP1516]
MRPPALRLPSPRSPAAQCTVGTASLSVIIPAYDEAERLPRTLEESLAHLSTTRRGPWEIIVVDDGSHDSTCEFVAARLAAEPRLRLLSSGHGRRLPRRGSRRSARREEADGSRLCGSRVDARELFPSLQIRGWAYDVQLLALAQARGYRIASVPVAWRDVEGSKRGQSNGQVTPLTPLQMAADLVALRLQLALLAALEWACEAAVSEWVVEGIRVELGISANLAWRRSFAKVWDEPPLCGSGVLAAGALALGASKATAVDVDAEALVVAAANLELNGGRVAWRRSPRGVEQRAELLHVREVVPGGLGVIIAKNGVIGVPPADVVVANILVGQLVRPSMVCSLCANLAPGGLLCLSGVRPHEIGSLKEAYGTWVEWEDWMYAEADPGVGGEAYWGTWARLVGRRVATPEQTAMLSEHAVS